MCADDKPGITNLIEILAVVRGATPADIEREFADAGGYGDFKRTVGEEVAAWLAPVRERYLELREDTAAIEEFLAAGAEKAQRDRRARWSPTCASGWASARRRTCPSPRGPRLPAVRIAELELDLDVFAGPFDLLLSLILREELDLLEVDLAEVVVAYLDHLEAADELDLEAATEFLVLIAALLELKSRLMLPGEEVEELDELGPAEAAEELVERMLQYLRFRAAGEHLAERHAHGQSFLYRSAPPKFAPAADVTGAYDPAVLGAALGGLLRTPPPIDLTHMAVPRVTVGERLAVLRGLLRRGSFSFDEAVRRTPTA